MGVIFVVIRPVPPCGVALWGVHLQVSDSVRIGTQASHRRDQSDSVQLPSYTIDTDCLHLS